MNENSSFKDYLMSLFELDILKARHVFTKEGKIPVKIPVRSSYTGKIFFRTYWKRPQDISPEHMKYVPPEYQKMLKNPTPEEDTPERKKTEEEYDKRVKHSEDWAEYRKKLDEEHARKKAEREKRRKEREAQQDPNKPKKTWQRGRKRLSDKEWEKRRKEEWKRNAELEWKAKQRELYPDDPSKWEVPEGMKFTPPNDPNLWKRKTPYKTKEEKAEAKVIFDPETHSKGEWAHIRVGNQTLEQIFRIPKSVITPPPELTEQADKDRYIMDKTQEYVYDTLVNPIAQENHCSMTEARRIAMDYMKAYGIVWHLGGVRWKMHSRDCVNWCHAVQKLKRYMWENARDDDEDIEPPEEPEPPDEPEPEEEPEPEKPQSGMTVNGVHFSVPVIQTIKSTVWKDMTPDIDSFTQFASKRVRMAGQQMQLQYTAVTGIEFLASKSRLIPFFKVTAIDENGDSHDVTFAASQAMVTWNDAKDDPQVPDIEPEPEEPDVEPQEEPDVEPPEEPDVEPPDEPDVEPPEEPDVEPPEEPEEPEPKPEKYEPKVQMGKNVITPTLMTGLGVPLGRVLNQEEFVKRIDTAIESDNTTAGKIKKITGIEVYDSWDTDSPDGGYILRLTYSAGRGKGSATSDIVIDSNGLFTYDMENISFAEGTPEYTKSGRKINYENAYKALIDKVIANDQSGGKEFSVEDLAYGGEVESDDYDKVMVFINYNLRVKVGRGKYNVMPMKMSLKSSYDGDEIVSRDIIQPQKPKKPRLLSETEKDQYEIDTEQQHYIAKYFKAHQILPPQLTKEAEAELEQHKREVLDAFDTEAERLRKKYEKECEGIWNNSFDPYTVAGKLVEGATNNEEYNRIMDEFNEECKEYFRLKAEKATVSAWGYVSNGKRKQLLRKTKGLNPDFEYSKRDSATVQEETDTLFSGSKKKLGRLIVDLHRQLTPYNSSNNCQRCVWAYELWRRGYNVMVSDPEYGHGDTFARIDPDTGNSVNTYDKLGSLDNLEMTWDGAEQRDFSNERGKTKITKAIEYMRSIGGDARFFVYVSYNDGYAHILNAEKRKDGTVAFIDVQHPYIKASDPDVGLTNIWASNAQDNDELMSSMGFGRLKYNSRTNKFAYHSNVGTFCIIRTDNLDLNAIASVYLQGADNFKFDPKYDKNVLH